MSKEIFDVQKLTASGAIRASSSFLAEQSTGAAANGRQRVEPYRGSALPAIAPKSLRKMAVTAPRQSLRDAIDAMCRSCIYDPIGGRGGWRKQVEDCTSPKCPLFSVRPRSTS
jgi:hypothetical protein